MKTLPEKFLQRMKGILGTEYPAFIASYDAEPVRGLRVNTQRLSCAEFERRSPWKIMPSGIAPDSYALLENAKGIGRHPYHAAGLIYVQEPSAALPVQLAGILPGMRVLDLCAAPGGKSGATLARLEGDGLLVANELVPGRAKTLALTLERMGAVNAAVTNARPAAVADAFGEYFDVVLVDAPCSGEGMFRKDDTAVAEWSEEHVAACAVRQRLILADAARCVAAGGVLVYSTCTFSRAENEANVEWFISEHPDFVLEQMCRLYPHTSAGEGHFAARLRRTDGARREQAALRLRPVKGEAYDAFMQATYTRPPEAAAYILPDGRVTLLAHPLPGGLAKLRVLTSGVMAGECVKNRFEPNHALFMAAHGCAYQRVKMLDGDVTDAYAAFMAGETVPCDASWRGYCAVAYDGFALGFGKADAGTLKNHLPKGLRMAKFSRGSIDIEELFC